MKSVAPLGKDALSVLATHELLDAEIIGYQKKRVAELSESEPERKKMVKARCYCSKTLVTPLRVCLIFWCFQQQAQA